MLHVATFLKEKPDQVIPSVQKKSKLLVIDFMTHYSHNLNLSFQLQFLSQSYPLLLTTALAYLLCSKCHASLFSMPLPKLFYFHMNGGICKHQNLEYRWFYYFTLNLCLKKIEKEMGHEKKRRTGKAPSWTKLLTILQMPCFFSGCHILSLRSECSFYLAHLVNSCIAI